MLCISSFLLTGPNLILIGIQQAQQHAYVWSKFHSILRNFFLGLDSFWQKHSRGRKGVFQGLVPCLYTRRESHPSLDPRREKEKQPRRGLTGALRTAPGHRPGRQQDGQETREQSGREEHWHGERAIPSPPWQQFAAKQPGRAIASGVDRRDTRVRAAANFLHFANGWFRVGFSLWGWGWGKDSAPLPFFIRNTAGLKPGGREKLFLLGFMAIGISSPKY